MSRGLMFWCAVLFLFFGTMVILYASGVLGGDRSGGTVEVAAADDDAAHDVGLSGDDAQPVGDFTFTDQKGRKFESTSLQGKIWVGSIFYASCPGTCRIQNTRVAELQKEFGGEGVEFLSITCDPDNDTPAKLNDYSKMFGAEDGKWHFLTGEFALAKKIGEDKFGITVRNQTHSDRLILFDRDGSLVGRYRSLEPEQFNELKKEIRQLLEPDTEEPEETGQSASEESTVATAVE